MLDKFLTINKKIFKKTNSKKVIALVNEKEQCRHLRDLL